MFKKIEIWILYLFIMLGIPITIGFGVLVRQEIEGVTKKGNIDISLLTKPAAYLARLPEKLIKIYLNPSFNRIDDPWNENRYFYNQNGFKGKYHSKESYLLLAKFDGDLKESVVELIDLTDFQVLHTWNPDINKFNKLVEKIDKFKYLDRDSNNSRARIFHPKLLEDGGLIFHMNGSPLMKIDYCSNLVFQNKHDLYHHSISIDKDQNIWVPSHMYPQKLPEYKVGRKMIQEGGFHEDAIVKLSFDGRVLYEKSVPQIFIENGLGYLLFSFGIDGFLNDPIHLNDIEPVDFDGEFWKKGDVFLSLRNQSMVLLYRPSTNKIIWIGSGPFGHQHDVNILDDHRISVLNNNSKYFENGNIVDGHNEVIIYDFKKNQYNSYLSKSLIAHDVRTKSQGRSRILPNGDLFFEETDYGRTLYFNSDGSLRWSHVNGSANGGVYGINWSTIIYSETDKINIKNFLKSPINCND